MENEAIALDLVGLGLNTRDNRGTGNEYLPFCFKCKRHRYMTGEKISGANLLTSQKTFRKEFLTSTFAKTRTYKTNFIEGVLNLA